MDNLSPRQLEEHAKALDLFGAAYSAYLAAWRNGEPAAGTRAKVLPLVPAADEAMSLAGYRPTVLPPRMVGGPAVVGLANLAFHHETVHGDFDTCRMLIDVTIEARAKLLARADRERRRRRNPLYWGDRFLRSVLGFPAYIVSLLLGVPRWKVDQSPWGTALRALAVVADGFAVWGIGRALGWW